MTHLAPLPYAITARRCPKAAVRGRVLLVAPNEQRRVSLREKLLRDHYAVTTVRGLEAICRQMAGGTINVILMDFTHNVEGGRALCTALRAADINDTILALHPAGTVDDMLEGFAAGADVYLRGEHEQIDLLPQLALICQAPPLNPGWKRLFGL